MVLTEPLATGPSPAPAAPEAAGPVAEAAVAAANSVGAANVGNPAWAALFAPAPRVTFDVEQLSCVTKPALTEGPFFVDEKLNRSDIRSDPSDGAVRPGAPLQLTLRVSRLPER